MGRTRGKEGLYMMTKTVSGQVVERSLCRITRRPTRRGMRVKGSSSEKKMLGNREQAKLRLARALNCNMGPGDLLLTAKFSREGLTAAGGDFAGAKEAGMKFIRRLCYRLKKQGITAKWFFVPSERDGETGAAVRTHVHIVITGAGFSLRDKQLCIGEEPVDKIWGLGSVDVQFLRHQADYYPLAAYLVEQGRGEADEKKWSCSRNLEKPRVTHRIVTRGGQLRPPAGAMVLPGTRYDPEKGQNIIRYLPKNPSKRDETAPGEWPPPEEGYEP